MNKPRINQHYVFKYYLKKWATNEKIACLKDKQKIFTTNLNNVAQERFFYKIDEFTNEELIVAKYMADNVSLPLVETYSNINNLIKMTKAFNFEELHSLLLEQCKDLEEKTAICHTENELIPLLEKLYAKDFSFLDNLDSKISFCGALSEQYCRTKRIKNNTNNALKSVQKKFNNINPDHIWFLTRHSIACKIGIALCYKNFKFCLLESNDKLFITGDQPLINVYADYNTTDLVEKFGLYYPLTPNLALFSTDLDIIKDKDILYVTNEQVEKLNTLIADTSFSQIYAKNERNLIQYKK